MTKPFIILLIVWLLMILSWITLLVKNHNLWTKTEMQKMFIELESPPRCPTMAFATGTTTYELEIVKRTQKSICPNLQ